MCAWNTKNETECLNFIQSKFKQPRVSSGYWIGQCMFIRSPFHQKGSRDEGDENVGEREERQCFWDIGYEPVSQNKH